VLGIWSSVWWCWEVEGPLQGEGLQSSAGRSPHPSLACYLAAWDLPWFQTFCSGWSWITILISVSHVVKMH
jgi:hypothetical protein